MKDVGLSTGIRRRFGRGYAGMPKGAAKVPGEVVRVLEAERRAWRVAPDGRMRARATVQWAELVEHANGHDAKEGRLILKSTGSGKELTAAERREYKR